MDRAVWAKSFVRRRLFASACVVTAAICTPALAQEPASSEKNVTRAFGLVMPIQIGGPGGYDWSGFYSGMSGAYAWNEDAPSATGHNIAGDIDGGQLGAFLGYNYQFSNRLVIGAEAEIDYGFSSTEKTYAPFTAKIYGPWQGSVSGRIGYGFDRLLIYADAGWAASYLQIDLPGGTEHKLVNGFSAGIGADYVFADNLFGRIEYSYADFGDNAMTQAYGTIPPMSADLRQSRVMLGIGYKF